MSTKAETARPTETTVKSSAKAKPLKATVEYIGNDTKVITVVEVDPRFDETVEDDQ